MLRPVLPFGVLKRKPPVLRASPICVLFDDGVRLNQLLDARINRAAAQSQQVDVIVAGPLSVRR